MFHPAASFPQAGPFPEAGAFPDPDAFPGPDVAPDPEAVAEAGPDTDSGEKLERPGAQPRERHLEELRVQLHKLDAFWRRHFVNQGEFRAAFSEFSDLGGFEVRLEADLRSLLDRRVAKLDTGPGRWVQGWPPSRQCSRSIIIFFLRSENSRWRIPKTGSRSSLSW